MIAALAQAIAIIPTPVLAQNAQKQAASQTKPVAKDAKSTTSASTTSASTAPAPTTSAGTTQYCAAVASTAVEVRIVWEMQQLKDLEQQIKQSTSSLQVESAAARDWVGKRQQMQKLASDTVVAIFAKMPATAASSQLAVMDEQMAASILGKLNPRVASGILAEMDAGKAARLNALLMASPSGTKS
jgi:flagellar motility protein MotE (MotC chaperone)